MSAITAQRDHVGTCKKDSYLNMELINRVQPMSTGLMEQVFKENALEKLNKNLFYDLSQYLVCIVDPQLGACLPWPIYDTGMERAYRDKLANFISIYSSKGLLSPVMSSYLVNPACYKVTVFISELSQLALQKILLSKLKEHQRNSYEDVTKKYKSENPDVINHIESETDRVYKKVSHHLSKRQVFERIAEMLRDKITNMEDALSKINAQKYIDDIVDGFVSQCSVDEDIRTEVMKLKQVGESSEILESWLIDLDEQISQLESSWEDKITPFLNTCKRAQQNTEQLIARHVGQADKRTYMIEYNHPKDYICTKQLQEEVNSQQKYILMNIVRDERLNFPNLIRGFLVAISFIMKGADPEDVSRLNASLEDGHRRYKELVSDMSIVLERVAKVDAKLECPSPVTFQQLEELTHLYDIPQSPDLSDLKMSMENRQHLFDTFTPLNTKQGNLQFNLCKQNSSFCSFPKPPKPGPYHKGIREDFMKMLMSSTGYDFGKAAISHNTSVISQESRVSEGLCGSSSGFTKEQIQRLLSSKKTSSKKNQYKRDRSISSKKTRLFNETCIENRSLYRSISSPNLLELKGARKRLSIVRDDSLPCLELSGITALDDEASYGTPGIETSQTQTVAMKSPVAIKSEVANRDMKVDFDKNSNERSVTDNEMVTPKMQSTRQVLKSNSLEKIINRYKLVRANVVADRNEDIVEENLNISTAYLGVSTSDKGCLPDLVSPNYNGQKKPIDDLEFFEDHAARMPRASLGTMLGVDQTFLDQFDLID